MKRTMAAVVAVASLILAGCGLLPGADADSGEEPATNQAQSKPRRSRIELASTFPTLEQLGNATLAIPEECVYTEAVSGPDFGTKMMTFANGTATNNDPNLGTTSLKELVPVDPKGTDAIGVIVACRGEGTSFDMLVAYDPNLQFVDVISPMNPLVSMRIGVGVWNGKIGSWTPTGTGVSVEFTELPLMGDGDCVDCHTSTATVELTWSGASMVMSDVVVHTHNGDVRAPDQDTLQEFYDAVSIGHGIDVAHLTSVDMSDLETGCIGGHDPAYECPAEQRPRQVHFPVGGIVDTCQLLPPDGWATIWVNGTYKQFPFTPPGQAGDYVCGIDFSQIDEYAGVAEMIDTYSVWLIVRSPADGPLTVVEFGRGFA